MFSLFVYMSIQCFLMLAPFIVHLMYIFITQTFQISLIIHMPYKDWALQQFEHVDSPRPSCEFLISSGKWSQSTSLDDLNKPVK